VKASEIIDKALTEVMPDESTWHQGDYANEEGDKHCTLGAIYVACGILDDKCESTLHIYGADHKEELVKTAGYMAGKAVEKVVLENYPQYTPIKGESVVAIVPSFNDEKGRTYAEVRAMMEKARASLIEVDN
jgi:hypothetical protein